MINLFEKFDIPSRDFLRSQIIAGLKVPSVVMQDDGFLPREVDSPFKYFCQSEKNNAQPLYFDKLRVPGYWKIVATSNGAQVMDMDHKRADVVFSRNDNSRLVREVHWLANNGEVNWVDHYDQHGHLFAKTYYENGKQVLTKYFGPDHQLVMTHNLGSGDIFLWDQDGQHHFASYNDFFIYYLHLRQYQLDHVFYNTLNLSMDLTLHLPDNGSDTLFWHERINGNQIPGNMNYVLDHETRTKHVVFQNYADWQRRDQFLPQQSGNADFRYMGMIFPHPRGNELRPKALILTDSDQVEQLDPLVKALPNIEFNIGAITEMSPKLMAFEKFSNVHLYPAASTAQLKQLLSESDIYLDINHADEIMDSVRAAFEQNMLLLAFDNTCHSHQFVADENIFALKDVDQMAQRIREALSSPDNMRQLVDYQRKTAGEEPVENFKEGMAKLINEG